MTTLQRPLPLNVVLTALVLCCVGGFAFGLTNAMKIDRGGATTSTQPLAEVSGVPVKDAARVDLELKTMIDNGCRSIQVCSSIHVMNNPQIRAVFKKWFSR